MIHCNIVSFSIVILIQINCKTHFNSFSCDDVLLKYHYYYYYYYYKKKEKKKDLPLMYQEHWNIRLKWLISLTKQE